MSGHKGKGQVVGYVRVSTIDQNEARQVEALGEVDRLFSEKVSGKSMEREQLEAMIDYVREGDVVRVKSPDRLSRSTRDLLALVEELRAKGVQVEFVDNPALNTDTANGEFMLTVLGVRRTVHVGLASYDAFSAVAIFDGHCGFLCAQSSSDDHRHPTVPVVGTTLVPGPCSQRRTRPFSS